MEPTHSNPPQSEQPSDPRPSASWVRLAAYLLGGLDPSERAAMARWIDADAERAASLESLRTPIQPSPRPDDAAHTAAALVQVMQRAGITGDSTRVGTMAPSSTSRRKPSHIGHQRNPAGRWLVGVTVAVIVGIGIAFGVTWHSRTTPTSDVGFTYATRSGEHVRITLRDGTTVTLAPDTRLSLSADFGRATRSVTLTGEAYFEVPNAARVPFVVGSGGIATRVLGTAFTVRRYETENTAQVTVFSGKVVSHNHDAFVTISAGRIAYISDSSATTTAIADVHTYMDWPAHRLVFRDAPIGEMLSTVGRWYGYTFTLADSAIARGNVSTTFDVTDANEALLMIRSLLGVTMRFNGTTITLAPGRRSQAPPRRMDVTKPLMEMGR